ncbi:hypothetical protein [Candidatus Palauibacter sp.]|uniref:hypothetical protein n=1 Tax=Candidatus Palauibacter sp. TaxID=3101350 RepID=UPI003CC67A6F
MRKLRAARKTRSAGAIIVLAAALAGCGDGTSGPTPPDITGQWVGQVVDESSVVGFDFRLSANDRGAITGTVTLQEEGDMISGTVIGLHEHPNVSLILEWRAAGRITNIGYSGNLFGADQIRGMIRFGVDATLQLDLDRVGG